MPNRFAPQSRYRLDRHLVHIGVLLGLGIASLGVLFVTEGRGPVGTLELSTQKLLSICILTGSTIGLIGACLGPGGWWFTKRIFPNFEVRNAYLFTCGGLIAVEVGLCWVAWTIATQTGVIGTATGALTPVLSLFYGLFIRALWKEHHRMTAQFEALKQALLANGHDHKQGSTEEEG